MGGLTACMLGLDAYRNIDIKSRALQINRYNVTQYLLLLRSLPIRPTIHLACRFTRSCLRRVRSRGG